MPPPPTRMRVTEGSVATAAWEAAANKSATIVGTAEERMHECGMAADEKRLEVMPE
jgi:hypothetical protein